MLKTLLTEARLEFRKRGIFFHSGCEVVVVQPFQV